LKDIYKKQVSLLLKVLPDVANEKRLALHGGTAINLFHQNMPRLSVDIDLTYIPFSNVRENDLQDIRSILAGIKTRLLKTKQDIQFDDQGRADEELKLLCRYSGATIKIEVNQINRGIIGEPVMMMLCENAQLMFDVFCEIQTVPESQLWGGKIIAALDRQHPRDLFDIRYLLNTKGYTDEIHTGFLFSLLGSKRPFHEILNPSRVDQSVVFASQFSGMTNQPFLYEEFESVRENLIRTVKEKLTLPEKEFLMSYAKGEPVWNNFNYSMFPGIKWKLFNIDVFKKNQKAKFFKHLILLEEILFSG